MVKRNIRVRTANGNAVKGGGNGNSGNSGKGTKLGTAPGTGYVQSHTPPTISKTAATSKQIKRKAGRPPGSVNKLRVPNLKEIKEGLLNLFRNSRSPAILQGMLNWQLPPGYAELFLGKKATKKEKLMLLNKIEKNYKWATEMCIKLFPRELGITGKMKHEHSLTGMVKRATVSDKSTKVEKLIAKQTESGITEYSVQDNSDDDDDDDDTSEE